MPMKKMKEKMEQKMAGRKKGPGGAKPPKGDFQHQGPGTGKAGPAPKSGGALGILSRVGGPMGGMMGGKGGMLKQATGKAGAQPANLTVQRPKAQKA